MLTRAHLVSGLICLSLFVLGAGVAHGLSTGFIVAWGENYDDQCDMPPLNAGFVSARSGQPRRGIR